MNISGFKKCRAWCLLGRVWT